jgi:hypothetical protein
LTDAVARGAHVVDWTWLSATAVKGEERSWFEKGRFLFAFIH